MKKQTNQSPPALGEALLLQLFITRFVEVAKAMSQRKQTKRQKRAAQILSRCLVNRYDENHPLPFGDAGKNDSAQETPQPWLSGDLAVGKGGPEFMYVHSPIRFVEDLLGEAIKVTSAPIKVPSKGQTKEGKLSTGAARGLAETFTTAGTVYLLNNLRAKLDEAVEDLFAESRAVVEEAYWATLDSSLSELTGVEKDPVQISQSRFTSILKKIVAEGDVRRRRRLRAAFWEIARGRGRPRGTGGSKVLKRFSKKEFLSQLNQKIRELSRASEAAVTRKQVAHALEFSNEKAFDRLRRQLGDVRRWRNTVSDALAGE